MKDSELSAIQGVEGRGADLSSTFSGLCLSLEANPRTAASNLSHLSPLHPHSRQTAQEHRVAEVLSVVAKGTGSGAQVQGQEGGTQVSGRSGRWDEL